MSPRAAWRLETLGFDAYDYVAGKQDWLAFGLPHEGDAVLAGGHVTTEVPTCGPGDRLGEVRDELATARFGMLVVTTDRGVVLGRLHRKALDAADGTAVQRLMREGPTTVRPGEDLEALTGRMRRADVDAILVTRSDGTLIGLLEREIARSVLEGDGGTHAS